MAQIFGKVIDAKPPQPGVAGLVVEAWGIDLPSETDSFSRAVTNEIGMFSMEIDAAVLRGAFGDRPPILYFRVFQQGTLIRDTRQEDAVVWSGDTGTSLLVIAVNLPDSGGGGEDKHTLLGKLVNQDDTPLVGFTVQATDSDAAPHKDLGSTTTSGEQGKEGQFSFVITTQRTATPVTAPFVRHLHLLIRDPQGQQILETDVTATEGQIFVVRVTFPPPPAEVVPHLVLGRLLNQANDAPLALYKVYGLDRGAGTTPKDLGYHITTNGDEDEHPSISNAGYFTLIYTTSSATPPPERVLNLRVVAPNGQEVFHGDVTVKQNEPLVLRVNVPEPPPPSSPPLEEVFPTLPPPPAGLLQFLKGKNINTIADVRRRGGVRHLEGIPGGADHPAVVALDQHASLSAISSDVQLNAALINKGYHSVADIANAPRTNFVGDVFQTAGQMAVQTAGEFNFARMQVEARAQTLFADNVLMAALVNRANGTPSPTDSLALHDLPPLKCECKDCEAVLSPRAYLAHLLDYTLRHVKDDSAKIDLLFLNNKFFQPFGDLPASCVAVDKQMRQVRLCIEVLRRYLKTSPTPVPRTVLEKAEKEYRLAAYTMLLNKIGTSYDEIRLARTAEREERTALAERLGIDLTKSRPLPGDELDQLFLDPDTFTEQDLERLFGYADTKRDPLSDGAKFGDEQIQRWNLDGIEWNKNTDIDGNIYLALGETPGPPPHEWVVELYRDSQRTQMVASGRRNTSEGYIDLSPVGGSGLSGQVYISCRFGTRGIHFSVVPNLLSWRLRHLRTIWRQEDYPDDPYSNRSLPIIDPDLIGLDDFRQPQPGKIASDLWRARRTEIDMIRDNLRHDRETSGLGVILRHVLGDPLPDLALLRENLQKGADLDNTKNTITVILHLTIESFLRLMEIKDKDDNHKPVSSEEWEEVYAILTQAEKVKKYIAWIPEEGSQIKLGLEQFWIALKEPKLTPWLATAEARQAWQQALCLHSRAPIIDPDLIGPGDLKNPIPPNPNSNDPGDPAYVLWQVRHRQIGDYLTELARQNANRNRASLDNILDFALEVKSQDLQDLADKRTQGESIEARLDQLGLSNDAFLFLLRIAALVINKRPVLESEWNQVYSILTQSRKRRLFAEWRDQEKEKGLTLGPDFFRFPAVDPTMFPPPPPPELPAWRASADARSEWQDTLQSRIDQEQTVIEAMKEIVSSTEEATLPALRDALVKEVPNGVGLNGKAKWVTDNFLIDAQAGGCQQTTRIAQAIETIQGLLFSLHTKQLSDTYPNLVLDADLFEDEWKWIGSYAAWRGAMAVYLYPENILLPSLRLYQTPAFSRLVKNLRDKSHLTPEQACVEAKAYSDYFQDVGTLRVEATCQTYTRIYRGDCRREKPARSSMLFYMFARPGARNLTNPLPSEACQPQSNVSVKVYWSAYDPTVDWNYAQTFWDVVPGLENVTSIVGAVAHTEAADRRFIYLFVTIQDGDQKKLVLRKYDLENPGWSGEPKEIEPPLDEDQTQPGFTAVLKQTNDESSPVQLAVLLPHGVIYTRQIDRDKNWTLLVGSAVGKRFDELNAMIEITPKEKEFYLVARGQVADVTTRGQSVTYGQRLLYRLFGPKDDGDWRPLQPNRSISNPTEFRGAFIWPETDLAYVFSGPTYRVYQAIKRSTVLKRDLILSNFTAFDAWLKSVTGVSLLDIKIRITDPNDVYYDVEFLTFFNYHVGNENRPPDWKERVKRYIAYIDTVLIKEDSPQGRSWKLADEMVGKFASASAPPKVGISLKEALEQMAKENSNDNVVKVDDRKEANKEPSSEMNASLDIECVATNSGFEPSIARKICATQRSGTQRTGAFRTIFTRPGPGFELTELTEPTLACVTLARVGPLVIYPFTINEANAEQNARRRYLIRKSFDDNANEPRSNRTYLEEAYYFVPIQLALQLQSRGQYPVALNWFRTVYDYSLPVSERKIYHGSKQEESLKKVFQQMDELLRDNLNPHSIAVTRANAYTRYTLLALVRCFLDFADSEFTRDTAESVSNARILYLTALELLDLPDLNQQPSQCQDLLKGVQIDVGDPQFETTWVGITNDLARVTNPGLLTTAINDILEVMTKTNGNISLPERLAAARNIVNNALASQSTPVSFATVLAGEAQTRGRVHLSLQAQPDLFQMTGRIGALAGQDFLFSTALVTGKSASELPTAPLPWLREPRKTSINPGDLLTFGVAQSPNGATSVDGRPGLAPSVNLTTAGFDPGANSLAGRQDQVWAALPLDGVFNVGDFTPTFNPSPSFFFCIPPNPIPKALRLHAELNLYKLRNCRNIAGTVRQLEPYSAPTDTVSGLPMIGNNVSLVLPGALTLQPTQYRYATLIERVKQLVSLAQQLEASLLATLEKRDAEFFNLLKAQQDVSLTQAGVRLQDLRVREAESGVTLAQLQQQKAQKQANHYQSLLDEGRSTHEQRALLLMKATAVLHTLAAATYGGTAILGAITFGVFGRTSDSGAAVSELAAATSAGATYYSTLASFERREQDWRFQKDNALQDVLIGAQQVSIAGDHVRVTGQERLIAQMQAQNAQEIAEFLTNKFTNVELYDWMSKILERVYSFFLQQATAMAQLAANQLAFERQEPPPPFIQADYWEAPTDIGSVGAASGSAPDRRGLTGSARLLQDIFQLDQHAFETNRRKFQLTKTISLARLGPAEFQRFRQTGVMPFATTMEMFDRDFPGHYLRLIKRVRTSVIALIPPIQGIRATLSTTGPARVVISGDRFQTVTMRRAPETVALTSPRDATGLFELDQQPEVLLPFEGLGVAASWEFSMPKAANLFDYDTIADVLITIEYTALDNPDYRRQVIQDLNAKARLSAERPFSFRNELADQWYDLNNPDQTATPMVVRFSTRREDFPPNLADLKIEHVVIFFSRAAGKSFEVPVTHLRFTEQDGGGPVGGGATSIDGIISTRRGNAGSWTAMIGKAPFGEWELALPNTEEVKNQFKDEEIEDILFVITYSGRTPEWPA